MRGERLACMSPPLALEQHEKREAEMSFVPTATAVLNPWIRILSALEKKITRQAFEHWLKPTRFSREFERTLYVRIPSDQFAAPLERYADLIHEAIERLGLPIDAVTFQTPQQDPATPKVRDDGGFAPLPTHSPNAPKPPATAAAEPPARAGWPCAGAGAVAVRLELRRAAECEVRV